MDAQQRWTAAALAAGSLGAASGALAAQPETAPEIEATEAEIASVPLDLPGHEEAPRSKPAPVPPETEKKEEDAAAREWFGGAPWTEWERFTGDWGGARTAMERAGISLAGSYTMHYSGVWSGGIVDEPVYRHLIDFNLTIDSEKLFALPGGTFFADFYTTDSIGSGNPGDFQGYSWIDTEGSVDQVAEVWWEQKLFDDVLRLKFGKIEANSEFALPTWSEDFMNSSAALTPTDFELPTYPDPAMGLVAFAYPTEWLYLGFGWFDGATHAGPRTGSRGPETFFSDSENSHWYFTGEAGLTASELGPLRSARLAVGGWGHTGEFEDFETGDTRDGAQGLYAIAEAIVWRPDDAAAEDEDERGLALYVQYGHADEDVSEAIDHVGVGAHLLGTFDGRDADSAGVYVSWVSLNRDAGYARDESVVEAFYKVQITGAISVQPDIQFIVNPGGGDEEDLAVVGSLRVVVSF